MIALTTGYWNYYGDLDSELTALLRANQISIEHRFFGDVAARAAGLDRRSRSSRSPPTSTAIVDALRTIYDGAWVTTGALQGRHDRGLSPPVLSRRRRRHGAVRRAAVVRRAATRATPRSSTRSARRRAGRRCATSPGRAAGEPPHDAMLARAAGQATPDAHVYTRIAIGPAVESRDRRPRVGVLAVLRRRAAATRSPPTTATDDQLWSFLERRRAGDRQRRRLDRRVRGVLLPGRTRSSAIPTTAPRTSSRPDQYTDADYAGALPIGVACRTTTPRRWPTSTTGSRPRAATCCSSTASGIRGPAASSTLGAATDSLRLIAPARVSHGADLRALTDRRRGDGVREARRVDRGHPRRPTAQRSARIAPPLVEPRIPPAVWRAIQLRRR